MTNVGTLLGANVNTLISIISKDTPGETVVEMHSKLGFLRPPDQIRKYEQQHFITEDYFIGIFEKQSETEIIDKVLSQSQLLKSIGARPCSGYNPYEVGKGQKPGGGVHTKDTVKLKPFHSSKKLGEAWKPEIVGRDLQRYYINVTGLRWIKYGPWLAAPRDPINFMGKRILVQEITGGQSRRITAAYYDEELYYSRDVIPIKLEGVQEHPYYILAVINSRFISWLHHRRNPKAKKYMFPKILVSDLGKLPIRTLDLYEERDKATHSKLVELVGLMMDLNKKLSTAKSEKQKQVILRRIDSTDQEIDRLVYYLYGLTEEEIAIVEESG